MNNYKLLNLNNQQHIRYTLFPDNQPHVTLDPEYIREGDEVLMTCSLTHPNRVMHLMLAANALDHMFAKKKILYIPYLMGARYDRVMLPGDSFDLQVIAGIINGLGFEKVVLLDPHSDVSKALITNSISLDNHRLVQGYDLQDAVLICPDAGAAKKISTYLKWNDNIKEVVYCTKERDLTNGNLKLRVLNPEVCKGRNCLIIDDICDGGRTFIEIATQVEAAHMTLIVTHGIFSKGVGVLKEHFNNIITTNSLQLSHETTHRYINELDVDNILMTGGVL